MILEISGGVKNSCKILEKKKKNTMPGQAAQDDCVTVNVRDSCTSKGFVVTRDHQARTIIPSILHDECLANNLKV